METEEQIENDETEMEEITTYEGVVKWFANDKGYGFIQGPEEIDYFVHHSNIEMTGFKTLDEGDQVSFEVGKDENTGKLQAINVTVL